MSQLIPFDFEEQAVRVHVADSGETWFVAADVCSVLGIANHRDAVSRLDGDEQDDVGITDALGRSQQTLVLNEPGLYSLVLTSRKPEAKRFKRWITHEVLPALRKTGSYHTGRAGTPSVNQQIAASRHRLALLKELHSATDRTVRVAIHQQLEHVSRLLGMAAPAIDEVGREVSDEPWVAAIELILQDMERGGFLFPHRFEARENDGWLLLRLTHCAQHLAASPTLKGVGRVGSKWLRAQLTHAEVIAAEGVERIIGRQRVAHLVALSVNRLRQLGVDIDLPPPVEA